MDPTPAVSAVDLLRWAEALSGIARTGLGFTQSLYERERFEEVLHVAADIKAAADDGVLAVVVFALAFGFAATRIKPELRRPLAGFFEAVAETMVVIVHWVLLAAPFGVFALALGVGLRAGLGVAGTLAHYVAIVCLSQIGLILIIYVVAIVWVRHR